MSKISDTLSERMGNSSVSDLFKVTDPEIVGNGEIIKDIELSKLVPFTNHPFKVLDDDKMEETKESIAKSGVLIPIIARPKDNDTYEIVSGHRRTRACELLGLETIPTIIRQLDDEESTVIMVDSNIQREELLFSEKAFAYKMKLEAIKRKAGRPHLEKQKSSADIVADGVGESKAQVKRYIRLTELTADLLNLTDEKKLPFNSAVEVSYLSDDEQEMLFDKIEELEVIPTLAQSKEIKYHSSEKTLTEEIITSILYKKTANNINLKFKTELLAKYFPKDISEREIKEILIKLLDE